MTTARSKVKSRSHYDVAHVHLLTNVPTEYLLLTPYTFRDMAHTIFYRSRSKVKSRSHHDVAHVHPLTPSIKFLHLIRFSRSSSLWQGQRLNQGHIRRQVAHIHHLMNVPTSMKFLRLTSSEI